MIAWIANRDQRILRDTCKVHFGCSLKILAMPTVSFHTGKEYVIFRSSFELFDYLKWVILRRYSIEPTLFFLNTQFNILILAQIYITVLSIHSSTSPDVLLACSRKQKSIYERIPIRSFSQSRVGQVKHLTPRTPVLCHPNPSRPLSFDHPYNQRTRA